MKILNAKHIEFPEYHKVYHLNMLGNFIDYRDNKRHSSSSQKFRLESLIKDIDIHGMLHPIIVSWNAFNVSISWLMLPSVFSGGRHFSMVVFYF